MGNINIEVYLVENSLLRSKLKKNYLEFVFFRVLAFFVTAEFAKVRVFSTKWAATRQKQNLHMGGLTNIYRKL
jgi:hypothetical protein